MPYFNPSIIVALVLINVGVIVVFCGYQARKSSTMRPEKKARAFKFGVLVGLVMIGVGIFTYAWEIMSPVTPEKIVQAERRRVTLPMDVDAITRWESVDAGAQSVKYTYSVRRIPRDRDGLANALRQQITQSVCGDKVYRDAIKQNISFEFEYKFSDETYPAITLSPEKCAG